MTTRAAGGEGGGADASAGTGGGGAGDRERHGPGTGSEVTGGAGSTVVDREMGCTPEDLLRWLPGASGHAPVRAEGDELVLAVPGGEVRLRAEPRPPRRIALLELPVLAVRFRFVGLDPAAREAFLERFDLYTRRGGG